MKTRMLAVRNWWHACPPRARIALKVALIALGLVVLGATSNWLRTERARLRAAMSAAEVRHKQMQDDIAEVLRLRAQSAPSPLQGKAAADAIIASVDGRKLNLAVTLQDTERIRVQGVTDFDDAVAWLGAMQRDHRLRLLTIDVVRQPTGVRLDVVLGPARL